MDQSSGVVMRIYPVERSADEPDYTRAFVGMPVGSEVKGVVKTQKGIGIVVLGPRESTTRVPHRLLVMAEDVLCAPLLGEHIGEPLGILEFGGPRAVAMVCPLLPWPQPEADA
jgi:hypothetical protein